SRRSCRTHPTTPLSTPVLRTGPCQPPLLPSHKLPRVQTLKVTKLVDTESQSIVDERLREIAIRPLIKHCVCASYDHVHNARIDEDFYAQRSMTETVCSVIRRSHGVAERARTCFHKFREIALMCVVHDIKRVVKPRIPSPYDDLIGPFEDA